jgi:predicted nucleic acid-binding protein
MILVDTSIWVRYADLDSPLNPICRSALRAVNAHETLCVSAQVLIELWAVATRPKAANGLGLSVTETESLIADIRGLCVVLPEPSDMTDRWLAMAHKYAPVGKPCHDLRLVANALANGVNQVLTLNTGDFTRYTEVRVVHPADV